MPHPRHVVCGTLEEALEPRRLRLPVRGQGARPPGAEGARAGPGRAAARGGVRARARRVARRASCSSRSSCPGREMTVNAFSVDGQFTPLTVTDRLVAEPPAFGVALAHVWPSSLAPEQVGAAVDAARAAAEALGVARRPDLHAGRRRRARGARRRARRPARRRPRRGALRGRARRRPERARALGRARRAGLRRAAAARDAGRRRVRRGSSCPSPASCRGGRGSTRRRGRGRRVGAHLPASPGTCSGPLRRGSDRAGAVLATGATREEAVERAGRGGRLRTLRRRQCPRRSCRLERETFLGVPAARGRRRGDRRRHRRDPLGLADHRAARGRARAALRRVHRGEARARASPPGRPRCTWRSSRSGSAPATR